MHYLMITEIIRFPRNRCDLDELGPCSDYANDAHEIYSSGIGGIEVYLGLVETRYDYQMSYLDEWGGAWRRSATKFESFNLVHDEHQRNLEAKLQELDLIVVLHSVSADSNSWLQKLSKLSGRSRAPMILFVGNEFSSPFLSTETRLSLINQISPEIIASQLPFECSSWLYEKIGSRIVSAPPGIPDTKFKDPAKIKKCDLGYRGYPYPWYLLDNERNQTVNAVSEYFSSRNMNVDISLTQRFDRNEWFDFLRGARFTVSSEAGSRFIFRDDQVWLPIQRYFLEKHKFSAIENDGYGMSTLRRLPRSLKKTVKALASLLGISQASLFKPDSVEEQILMDLVDTSRYEHRNGKCISSRHLDGIASGTWQILKPGEYSGILRSGEHFTSWDGVETESLIELINDENLTVEKARSALESLRKENTYDARVKSLIGNLR